MPNACGRLAPAGIPAGTTFTPGARVLLVDDILTTGGDPGNVTALERQTWRSSASACWSIGALDRSRLGPTRSVRCFS